MVIFEQDKFKAHIYSPFCVPAEVIKLVGPTRAPFLSPTNLITFASTQYLSNFLRNIRIIALPAGYWIVDNGKCFH